MLRLGGGGGGSGGGGGGGDPTGFHGPPSLVATLKGSSEATDDRPSGLGSLPDGRLLVVGMDSFTLLREAPPPPPPPPPLPPPPPPPPPLPPPP